MCAATISVMTSESGVSVAVVANVFKVEFNYPDKPSFCPLYGLLLVPFNENEQPYLRVFLTTRLDGVSNIKPNRKPVRSNFVD